jgi:hypothetical protein
MTNTIESSRAEVLRKAQNRADDLFQRVETNGLIRAGITESQLNEEIYKLAEMEFGIEKYWHKRIVRAGPNTLAPYEENPPDLTIAEDDIVFLDLGPVFEEWEADFGRTFVVGSDPVKRKLRDDIAKAFIEGKEYFRAASRHHRRGALPARAGPGGEIWLGIRRSDRRPPIGAIPARENSGRQDYSLRPSAKSKPHA